uniref:CBAH domain-containing protein n=1 Tax=Caenorhabditis japonica TaxID=281687 RepID=A0A8R1E385_CAEJA
MFQLPSIFGLGCTSIVAQDEFGQVYHGRNLDYDMTNLLKNITFYVDFERNGVVLYSGITFALYNGVLTGQRPHGYTVSLNARYSGAYIDNIIMELYTKFKRPVSYFIREVLETVDNYPDAVATLSKTHLFSPSYIIVAGAGPMQGALISRNRWSAADVHSLDEHQWFLVETNYDNWRKQGDERRYTAIRTLKKMGKRGFNATQMGVVLSEVPVRNNLTVFSAIMAANRPSLMSDMAWVWDIE